MNTTTNISFPASYRRLSECPHCGAPIYCDAAIPDFGGTVTTLPTPFYTCACRFTNVPQPVYVPYPAPAPNVPDYVPTIPTWIVTCGQPTTEKIPEFDWKQFCGSGGVTSTAMPGSIHIL